MGGMGDMGDMGVHGMRALTHISGYLIVGVLGGAMFLLLQHVAESSCSS
jgi:hypothetical protein